MIDLYKILGVQRNAGPATVEKAFRKRAKETHPDRNPGDPTAAERFQQVKLAGDVLRDPERRKRYDESGDTSAAPANDRQRQVVGIVLDVFRAVVQPLVKSEARLEQVDIVQGMRQQLEQFLVEADGAIKAGKKSLKRFNIIAERMKLKDGDDILADVLSAEMAGIEEHNRRRGLRVRRRGLRGCRWKCWRSGWNARSRKRL